MYKQIRHTYYYEELFLIKHKTKHSCESAIFYNLTADVVYSVCQFDYFYNTTSLMEVQISSWPTCSALRGLFVEKIPPWPDLCPATHMY